MNICDSLLTKNPLQRLGNGIDGEKNIRNHVFFSSIDWSLLESKRIKPPYQPKVKGTKDTSNFDCEFTNKTPKLTPIDTKFIMTLDQNEFCGFTFINPDFAETT